MDAAELDSREGWLGYVARCAMSHDTLMARAFLRALGIPVPDRPVPGTIVRADRYAGMDECFAQRYGVRL